MSVGGFFFLVAGSQFPPRFFSVRLSSGLPRSRPDGLFRNA